MTGLQLPLVSAGGSSLAITLFMFGVIANAARHEPEAVAALNSGQDGKISKLLRLPKPVLYHPPSGGRPIRRPKPARQIEPARGRDGRRAHRAGRSTQAGRPRRSPFLGFQPRCGRWVTEAHRGRAEWSASAGADT